MSLMECGVTPWTIPPAGSTVTYLKEIPVQASRLFHAFVLFQKQLSLKFVYILNEYPIIDILILAYFNMDFHSTDPRASAANQKPW